MRRNRSDSELILDEAFDVLGGGKNLWTIRSGHRVADPHRVEQVERLIGAP